MKAKRILWALMAVCVLLCTPMLSACEELPNNEGGVTIYLTVADLESQAIYAERLSCEASSLGDLLRTIDGIEAVVNAWGFLDSITVGEKTLAGAAAESTYLALYHTIDQLEYKDLYMTEPFVFDEKSYFYSGVGVNDLPILEGQSYLVVLSAF